MHTCNDCNMRNLAHQSNIYTYIYANFRPTARRTRIVWISFIFILQRPFFSSHFNHDCRICLVFMCFASSIFALIYVYIWYILKYIYISLVLTLDMVNMVSFCRVTNECGPPKWFGRWTCLSVCGYSRL